jgi:hypothetical protein
LEIREARMKRLWMLEEEQWLQQREEQLESAMTIITSGSSPANSADSIPSYPGPPCRLPWMQWNQRHWVLIDIGLNRTRSLGTIGEGSFEDANGQIIITSFQRSWSLGSIKNNGSPPYCTSPNHVKSVKLDLETSDEMHSKTTSSGFGLNYMSCGGNGSHLQDRT